MKIYEKYIKVNEKEQNKSNKNYLLIIPKIFRSEIASETVDFAQCSPPPHALPSSAQKFSPPGRNFSTKLPPPNPEIISTQPHNFIL